MLALFGLALGLGFRHGYDLDHVVALSDIAATRKGFRRAMVLSALYAGGHALIVAIFGIAIVFLGASLPPAMDIIATIAVGATLLGMGIYVLIGVIRHGSGVKLQSRGGLILKLLRRRKPKYVEIVHDHEHGPGHGHVEHDLMEGPSEPGMARTVTATKVKHTHVHAHVAPLPEDPMPAFGIGIAHGIGAETPTQIALFAAAAGSGKLVGSLLVVVFLVGLFIANMIVATFANFSVASISRWKTFVVASSVVIGLSSIFVGATTLLSL